MISSVSVDKMDPQDKHKLQTSLDDMRDRGTFAFFMLNALWIAFVFPILLAQDRLKDMLYIPIPIPSLYYQPVLIEPLGVLHLGFFAFISLVQFLAMLCHRYNTFQHILASTKLRSNIHEGMRIDDIIDTVKMLQQIKPIDEEAEPMPDYSDEEIDKISDDISDQESISESGKKKYTSDTDYNNGQDGNESFLRQRGNKYGHDNPAFLDDTNVNSKIKKTNLNSRSKSEDRVLDGGQTDTTLDDKLDQGHKIQGQAKRNRRSRRLQKKNSLDVQFRRRFSMLRDGNVAVNNMYNTSEAGGFYGVNNGTDFDLTNGISASGIGRESRTSQGGPRASSGNLSAKILDKRFNKILFNMHGIPIKNEDSNIKSNVLRSASQEGSNTTTNIHPRRKGNRKQKSDVVEQHV